MPWLKRPNSKPQYYHYKIEVPYQLDPSGSIFLYMKRIPGEKATPHCPATLEDWEIIDWDGVLYDDDYVNVLDDAKDQIFELERDKL